MAVGWNGADPVEQADANDYELGTEYLANQDVTISHIRVWSGAGEVNVTDRRGRIWNTGGGQLGIATMTDDLTPGWTTHPLDTPVQVTAASKFVVSYSTGGNYGALVDGLATADVVSADTALTALSTANAAPNGNGVFNATPGSFPTISPGAHPFYGADVVYSLGLGGNTAPVITQATVVPAAATVTATIVATDAETLVGASYRFDWLGDGTTVTVSASNTAQHTYAQSGTYGVLLQVTDAGGLSDYAAVGVDVAVPSPAVVPFAPEALYLAVLDHALASGLFDTVNGHEPKSAPGLGLAAAVWADAIDPVPGGSGLNVTTMRLGLNLRIYSAMLQEPQDAIDPNILAAVSTLMAAYSGDFTLGGLLGAQGVDLLGRAGQALSARAGYLNQDNRIFRVMTILLPLIVPDCWEQAP